MNQKFGPAAVMTLAAVCCGFRASGQPCEPGWNVDVEQFVFNGQIRALLATDDGLCVAGVFTSIDGDSTRRIAMFNEGAWQDMGVGFDAPVFDLIVFDDAIHAVGTFTQSGSVITNRIARWGGEAWENLGAGLSHNTLGMHVSDISGEECLYVGGTFATAGESAAVGIARWDGEAWSPLAGGLQGGDKAALVMVDFDDGEGEAMFVGGSFVGAGGQVSPNIVRWDGANWSPVGAGLNGIVRALVVFQGQLIAGGEFTQSGGAEVLRLARWTGTQWEGIDGGASGVVYMLSILETPTGDQLVVGGLFNQVGGIAANSLALYDGETWTPIGESLGPKVNDVERIGDELFVGGDVSVSGIPKPALRRWSLCLTGVTGDLTGDGVVNGADLAALLSQWGQPGPADLTGDGTVNGADLATLLSNWG